MRPIFKYIFCGLVLAALIFISFCVFYIANTYAVNIKNKNKPIFPYHSASYFANVSTPEIREIENTTPPVTPTDGGELPDGSAPHSEPSTEDSPYTDEEPELEQEPEQQESQLKQIEPDITSEEPEPKPEPIPFERMTGETEPDNTDIDGFYHETELLYSILVTMKINQYIMIAAFALWIIVLIYKPLADTFFS